MTMDTVDMNCTRQIRVHNRKQLALLWLYFHQQPTLRLCLLSMNVENDCENVDGLPRGGSLAW